MESVLTDEDLQLMLAEIRRFCQRSIAPLVERPERLISAEQLQQLTRQATEIGVINLEPEAAAGIWENLDANWGRQLSSTALFEIARVNAGIAFHFHQLAMGSFLKRRLEIDDSRPAIVCVQGRYGLARQSLARLLRGRQLDEDDVQLLRSYFVTLQNDDAEDEGPLLFQAADEWQQVLVPTFNQTQGFAWLVFVRDDSSATPIFHSHGLNETLTWKWQPRHGRGPSTVTTGDSCLASYVDVMNINAQALVAIGLGALQQGYEKAAEYAAVRWQAGKPLIRHAAVQRMLGNCFSTIHAVDLLRRKAAELDLTPENLGQVLGARAQTHDLLCAAANDVLQVFGGIGYMQETGLEKVVRDNNHLRLLCGTPTELRLFLAGWESEP
jgi:alkylation response protein AidB-like acyl-CoA dehydrogenase